MQLLTDERQRAARSVASTCAEETFLEGSTDGNFDIRLTARRCLKFIHGAWNSPYSTPQTGPGRSTKALKAGVAVPACCLPSCRCNARTSGRAVAMMGIRAEIPKQLVPSCPHFFPLNLSPSA